MAAPRGSEVWRDYVTDGIPSSGANKPKKSDIRSWSSWLESMVTSGVLSSGPWFATKAAMTLGYAANTVAIVYNDPTAANNGLYIKSGASGSGSWTQLTSFLPGYQFVTASPTGASTANAIVASTSPRLPAGDGVALVTLVIPATNTASPVTVRFDGGAVLTIKTRTGENPDAGELQQNDVVAGFVSGATFRLISDLNSLRNFQSAKAWANNAEDVPVSTALGGDGVTTFSAKHWAAKSGQHADRSDEEADRSREEADRSEAARDIAAGYADDAAALANSDIYATTAGMSAITVPAGLSAILVKGKNSVGDGEGGLFYRVGTVNPVLRRAFQSAGGVWWAPVNAKIARLLWTGQSNADQPWCNSPTPDAISPFARIWDGGAGWVALAAGKGGVRAEATNHSLFNMTRIMIEEGGYDRIEVVFSTYGGRPIREWSGTPTDRTLSVANRPRMKEIVDKTIAAGGGKYTHVVMVQGEADSLSNMFPLTDPLSYIAQREYFRQDMVDRGYADANTRWLEGELLRREVAGTSWHANTAISRLDQVGRDHVAIVSSEGFVGKDEALEFNLQGKMIPYTLHFSPSENSEYGRRMARAALDLDKPKERKVSLVDQSLITPWGVLGAIQPYIKLTAGTHTLSSVWTRDGYVDVEGVCNVTLLDDDLRLGARINAGRRITFRLANGATLNLTTQTIRIYQDINGGKGGFSNTLTRKQVTVGGTIELFFDGSNWYMLRDLTLAGAAGGLIWEYHAGYLRGYGNTSISALTALSQVAVTFPAEMPVITNTTYIVAADNGCRLASKSLTGFVLERAVAVPAAAAASIVNFSFGGMLIA